MYRPSICLVAQGGKRVECGGHKLTYISGFTLAVASATSVKGRVIEASRERPLPCARIEPGIYLMRIPHCRIDTQFSSAQRRG
ncbi:AraC family transcriptional regulator N-terminal domain-containing protein [Ensifer sp. ENS06]|nr:AraC family transcriptional regulator N-terminal domain-containing protein [Ensifer sp. ENS06]